jgi:hypothetical protein
VELFAGAEFTEPLGSLDSVAREIDSSCKNNALRKWAYQETAYLCNCFEFLRIHQCGEQRDEIREGGVVFRGLQKLPMEEADKQRHKLLRWASIITGQGATPAGTDGSDNKTDPLRARRESRTYIVFAFGGGCSAACLQNLDEKDDVRTKKKRKKTE